MPGLENAEVTRDEFGGYCCKRWGAKKDDEQSFDDAPGQNDDNICKLLGLDIERKALEIVRADFTKKGIPIGALSLSAPNSEKKPNQK